MVDRSQLLDRWHRSSVVVRDLPLALVLAVGPLIPSWRNQGTQLGGLPDRPLDALAAVAIALQCLPLAGRRRWPAASFALVVAGFAIDQLRGYHTVAGVALAVSLVSVAAHLGHHRRTTAAAATVAYVALAVGLHRAGAPEGPDELATFYVVTVLAWAGGAWLRRMRHADAERAARAAADARAAERDRIARELHDVVTHHVTAMVVQTEAAKYLVGQPERLEESLTAVTDTGRRAIGDLRSLLQVLDPGHDRPRPDRPRPEQPRQDDAGRDDVRAPTVGEISTLVEQTRRAGQPVDLVEEGDLPVPAPVRVAVYRVVQESLTNALKHAHGSRTTVHVRHTAGEVVVEVTTDGAGGRSAAPGGSERGLAGLRERVGLLGGELTALPVAGGGFVVRAAIPAGGAA